MTICFSVCGIYILLLSGLCMCCFNMGPHYLTSQVWIRWAGRHECMRIHRVLLVKPALHHQHGLHLDLFGA